MIDISFISQEQTLFEGQAKMVVMDGKEGQLGVVKGHSPLLAILKPGPVRMITDDNEEVFFTNGGFAEVQPDHITILVDSALRADDLDEAKILKAKEEAEKLLKDLSKERQTDPNIWYKLAEAQGLSGNILELHRSRAEFFILTGRHDAAVFQLKEALSLSQNLFEIRESIIKRLEEIFATKRAINELS